MNLTKSRELLARARKLIPGGVNSPVRAFRSVGGEPPFIRSAKGATITDEDGNTYIDYVGSWGPMILGHTHPAVVEAIERTARDGASFGAPTRLEVEMAERIVAMVPSVEVVRMVSSGTEATMSAVRLARGYTGRDRIIKFSGCYHGHGDSFLIQAGSGVATLGLPDSPGVTKGTAQDTLTARFNDLGGVEALFEAYPDEIACVIVEPVVGNMGCVPPLEGFHEGLRDLCDQHGALFIFDEVMTGFRVAAGGAQERYGITPDLTTLGKIVGGGLPVGAYGGRAEIMAKVAPAGPVYQAGTLSGNPLAMAAGMKTLEILAGDPGIYDRLEATSARLAEGLAGAARAAGMTLTQNRVGSMMTLFFTDRPVRDYDDAKTSDTERYGAYFRGMLERGVYLAPSQFEAAFVSAAHTNADIDRTIQAAKETLASLA